MSHNRFRSGHDVIEVYGMEEEEQGFVTCIDAVEGFMFLMEPAELTRFLNDHGYEFEETESRKSGCTFCGYIGDGETDDGLHCPECGKAPLQVYDDPKA